MTQSQTHIVRKVAELARLAIPDDEAAAIGTQFAHILAHFEVLARVPVEDVEPMLGGLGGFGGLAATSVSNVLRDDEPQASLAPDAVLADAPQRVDDFYGVPKTIGGDE